MDDYVPFELAKKLKEKGFREKCLCRYCNYSKTLHINEVEPKIARKIDYSEFFKCYNSYVDSDIDAPTISQVLEWLRGKNIYCLPWFEQGVDMWFYAICKPAYGCEFPEFISNSDYDTYKQAALAGIEYVLDNLI
jgi:hypothetical protein